MMKTPCKYFAAVVGMVLAGSVGTAMASPINQPGGLGLQTHIHDVSVPTESIVYTITGSTATLTASAPVNDIGELDFSVSTITNETMTLSVSFTQNGSTYAASSGSLIVSGKISNVPHTFFQSGTLLAFGFTENAGPTDFQDLEFVFAGTVTGDYGRNGMGVILHSRLNDSGNNQVTPNNFFNTAFTNTLAQNLAQTDVFDVPEPTSLALLSLAMPLLLRRRRPLRT